MMTMAKSLGLPAFQLWSLQQPSFEHQQFCYSLTFLSNEQKHYCHTNPKMMRVISRGVAMAIDECQYQFRNQRWNCTIFNSSEVFGKIVLRKTPETAFIYALTSAAVVHAVGKACAKGELSQCGCDKQQQQTQINQQRQQRMPLLPIKQSTISSQTLTTDLYSENSESVGWEWGGCSHDIKYGRNVSKTFVDGQESINKRKIVRIVNIHNNEAGRQAVERNVQLTCKCHGVSGSCTLRVCWRTLPDFRIVGSELRLKYQSATQVRLNRRLNILKPRKRLVKLFNVSDLVYVHQSPSFCEKNLRLGSLGTQGRPCNLTVNEPGSCSVLCCDRGYEIVVKTIEQDCECQFHWCCEVRCRKCLRRVEQYFCK
ncbi:unnamed protein product [Didymodactylos carnosus]|uniref:Protein Wnt n=2 Tax=Didymodactylos carnosus TaxID=1234261 RepID=A0A8S2CQB3_9BILA|nr:unnamed protein product [Didymodactylos carnosus]CAF3557932.1 unnamed protein product [Didymodactylos carnosus]